MPSIQFTARQQLTYLLTQDSYTALELSRPSHLSERQVEDHLAHIIRSLKRESSLQFVMEEPKCLDCGYAFRNRTRLKRPSRCPRCRSEAISYPRFSIIENTSKSSKKKNSTFKRV